MTAPSPAARKLAEAWGCDIRTARQLLDAQARAGFPALIGTTHEGCENPGCKDGHLWAGHEGDEIERLRTELADKQAEFVRMEDAWRNEVDRIRYGKDDLEDFR